MLQPVQFTILSDQADSVVRNRCCSSFVFVLQGLLLACIFSTSSGPVQAEEYVDDFDGDEIGCRLYFDEKQVQLKLQERTKSLAFSGMGAERFQFVAAENNVSLVIETAVKPTRVFEELRISAAVFCNRPGTQLAARVVFPHQIDPTTKEPVTRLFVGQTLTEVTKWQELKLTTTDSQIGKHLILWRASLKPQELDPREMYIDRVYLKQTLGKGMTEIMLDNLRMSPIVEPETEWLNQSQAEANEPRKPTIEFQLDRLIVEGRPMFPVIVPYQHEPVELFKQIGPNVVWVDNYLNRNLVNQLNRERIWATAWPPSVKSENGKILDAAQGSLAPFGEETDGVLFWNLGVRIDPTSHQQLKHWVHQVKTSDREQRRPILADVTAEETIFSRDVDMLGISKHILQTPYSLKAYSEHLKRRMRRAQPGTFVISWLQTEPSREIADYRKGIGLSPASVEPEQIRLQTYHSLCAGCKGLGYWNWTPLNAEGPGFEERRLVLEQLMTELDLLEPFLAGGEVIDKFQVSLSNSNGSKRNPIQQNLLETSSEEELSCALIRSEHGLVILMSTLEPDSQYVPGPLAANDLKILVRSLPESAFLWQITPTGLWPLETSRKAGGTEIRIPRFNMTAALMVATDQGVAQEMERKIQQIQSRAAELSLELAEAKFERVQKIDSELNELGVGLSAGSHLLLQSRRLIEESRLSLKKQHYHQTRDNAEMACQLLRILQRTHWQNAVQHLSSPTSVPHAVCFQTLPDYWKLIQLLGQQEDSPRASLVHTANFEDADSMRVEGWTRDVTSSKQVAVYDALDPSHVHEGDYCLRMVSVPTENQPVVTIDEPVVRYETPAIPVKAGELLHVTGWIRIPRPLTSSLEGFRIYDTQFGSANALQWSQETEWKQFEMMRPIWKQEDVHIVMELYGLGDVAIDHVQIKTITLPSMQRGPIASLEADTEEDSPTKTSQKALDLLKGFLK